MAQGIPQPVVVATAPRRSVTRPSPVHVEAFNEICSVMELARTWFLEKKLAPNSDTMVRMTELTLRLAREREDAEKREAFERRNGIDA